MRKFLLTTLLLGSVSGVLAQTGSMVREDRIWNYDINTYLDELVSTHYDEGFHFDGVKTIDGNCYSVFRDNAGEELSLIRQDGGKVYLTDQLLSDYVGDRNEPTEREVLLYDFSAEVGDTYTSVTFDEIYFSCWSMAEVTVKSKSTMSIAGEEVVRMTLEYKLNENQIMEYQAVEGIGISQGRLDQPQCAHLTSGMRCTYAMLNSVTNPAGEIIFTGNDFLPQTSGLIREDRIWVYSQPYAWEWRGKYEYKMRFDGTEEIDGHIYHRLTAYDARLSWCKYPDPTPIVVEKKRDDTYLLREENGRVYLHKDEVPYHEWGDFDGHEALLYDFNAEEGDEMEIITSLDGLTSATVRHAEEVIVDNERCRMYDMYLPVWETDYTVVEGLGNITWGNLSKFYVELTTDSGNKLQLEMVTDLEGNVIYEGNDEWPGEFNSVVQTASDPGIGYDGSIVSAADGESITIYTLSGKTVATGTSKVSTSSLQRGIYVARTGAKTLKIFVK